MDSTWLRELTPQEYVRYMRQTFIGLVMRAAYSGREADVVYLYTWLREVQQAWRSVAGEQRGD